MTLRVGNLRTPGPTRAIISLVLALYVARGMRQVSRGRLVIGTMTLVAATGCGGFGADRFVRMKAPVVALTHVRVIDGTGRPAVDDQTLVLQNGRVGAVGPSGTAAVPSGAQVVDLSGGTVIPGAWSECTSTFFTKSNAPHWDKWPWHRERPFRSCIWRLA